MLEHHTEKVFCDWLDFTVPVEQHSIDSLSEFFCLLGFHVSKDGSLRPPRGRGTIKITKYGSVIRVSVSGACLGFIRSEGLLTELVGWMAETPHHITRLDAAYDIEVPGHKILSSLIRKYRGKEVKLTQRGLPVTTILTSGNDGNQTGTFYVGHRSKAQVTARVYDKQHELYHNHGMMSGPLTRYEITVRGDRSKVSPCLRDLYDPTSLFFHFASPSLLKSPSGVPRWEPNHEFSFKPTTLDGKTAYEVLERFIDTCGIVETLHHHTKRTGAYGRSYALKLLGDKLAALDADSGVVGKDLPCLSTSPDQQAPLA